LRILKNSTPRRILDKIFKRSIVSLESYEASERCSFPKTRADPLIATFWGDVVAGELKSLVFETAKPGFFIEAP
jgi:hypothetical protein